MITTENLTMRFPDTTGLRYRDMRFETGRSYALLGASGCGKSTFLNLIAGILTPASGSITIDGKRVTDLIRQPFGLPPSPKATLDIPE